MAGAVSVDVDVTGRNRRFEGSVDGSFGRGFFDCGFAVGGGALG